MSPSALAQLAVATTIFSVGAISAKSWAVSPSIVKIVLTLALYTLGNLIMMRLVRTVGMSTAFSVSAVAQLVAINLVAIVGFGERLGWIQGAGVAMGVLSIALITLGPSLGSQ
jgi:glucose uptake protein GlcU